MACGDIIAGGESWIDGFSVSIATSGRAISGTGYIQYGIGMVKGWWYSA
jgi:hypothetical protein